jgi:S1-C subfamily serine protease
MFAARFPTLVFIAVVASAVILTAVGRADDISPERLKLSDKARLGGTMSQFARALENAEPVKADPLALRTSEEKLKGLGLEVYPKIAPAVVVIHSALGHGTGFLIDGDGWLITNHHVVRTGKPDPKTGALQLVVYMGKLENGVMQIIRDPVPAQVYKANAVQDLALVKLSRKPKGLDKLPFLPLASDKILPGTDCVAVGHPASGILWTLRSGEVSGIANWPQDMVDIVVKLMVLPPGERDAAKAMISRMDRRKVVLSSCGLNPGDSGGPLVNKNGEIIAVSFAIPAVRESGEVGKFSYHVHLDELKAFLADRNKLPATAPAYVPDVMPSGVMFEIVDLARDGTPDALVFGKQKNQPPSGLLLDLRGSNEGVRPDDLLDPKKLEKWKFQFAFHREPYPTAFYDTRGSGEVDLVLMDTDNKGRADVMLRRVDGKWVAADAKDRSLIDPALFADKQLQRAFGPYARLLDRTMFRR